MKPWAQLCFSVTLLAQAAYAVEVELAIAPPQPEWLLPPQICRSSSMSMPVCVDTGVVAPDASSYGPPTQVQPEGIPDSGEEQMLLDIRPLVAAGDFEAVLARLRMSYGPELALLELGDREGFLRTRIPTDGRQPPRPPTVPRRPQARPMDTGDIQQRPSARASADSAFSQSIPVPRVSPDVVSASMLYVIGHSYFSLEQYLPAETAFKLILGPMPTHVRAHESLGMLYLRTERYADARVHLARVVQLGRNTAHVHSATGYLEQQTHRYRAAADAFQRALVLAPGDRSAQRGLLHALTETREHAKARALVEQLLQAEPNDADLWRYRAQIALSANDRASALASLEAALRLGDDSVANRQTCAALHMESGNIARAVDLLRGSARGLAFPLVDQALGWLANENEWDRFRVLSASIDRAALGGTDQSRLLTRRATLALHDGDRRAASTALQEALALDPANADALMALGQILRAERDYGRADLLYRRASSYGAVRDNALVARVDLAIDQENFDNALTLLRNGVTSNPAHADLRRNIDVLEDIVLLRAQR